MSESYIIRNPTVLHFIDKIKDNPSQLLLFENIIANICNSIINFQQNQNNDNTQIVNDMISKLQDNIVYKIKEEFTKQTSNIEYSLLKFNPDNICSKLDHILNNLNHLNDDIKKNHCASIELINDINQQLDNLDINLDDLEIPDTTVIKLQIDELKNIIISLSDDNRKNNNSDSLLSFTNIIETKFQSIQQLINTQTNKLDSIDKTINKTNNNSSIKGKIFENNFADVINKEFSQDGYLLINTSNKPNSADFLFTHIDRPDIIIDTKDYSVTVPKSEVDKLKRDCIFNKSHGILISNNTNIASKKNPIDFEQLDNKFVVYLPNNQLNISLFKTALQLIYFFDSKISSNSSNIIIPLSNKQLIIDKIISHNSIINELETLNKNQLSTINHLKKILPDIEHLIFNTRTDFSPTNNPSNPINTTTSGTNPPLNMSNKFTYCDKCGKKFVYSHTCKK